MAKELVFQGMTPEDVQHKVDAYFASVEATKRELPLKNGEVKVRYETVASMVGLALFLGIRKDVLYDWMEYRERQGNMSKEAQNGITEVLREARDRIERSTLDRAATGDYEPKIAGMILGGMGYGYKEDHSPTIKVRIEGGSTRDVEDWSR